jgi:hypothetical protein
MSINQDPVVLFRNSREFEDEWHVCRKYFPTVEQRTACRDQLVIARYSALPYYRELEIDLQNLGCRLINSYAEHSWIANFDYYQDLAEFTPESWDDYTFQYCDYPGPFVIKGRTNSRKFEWNRLMFAPTRKDAIRISAELAGDGLIGPQGVIYRKYIPLRTFEVGLNGLPFTNEFRFFFFREQCLSYGYYWSSADDVSLGQLDPLAFELAHKVAKIAAEHVPFFVLDLAETEEGNWILIEVNDGQQSGLSENDPELLYSHLKVAFSRESI